MQDCFYLFAIYHKLLFDNCKILFFESIALRGIIVVSSYVLSVHCFLWIKIIYLFRKIGCVTVCFWLLLVRRDDLWLNKSQRNCICSFLRNVTPIESVVNESWTSNLVETNKYLQARKFAFWWKFSALELVDTSRREDWWTGIVLPLYKGNGSKIDCADFRA